jgi:hypothetical protein
MPQTEHCSPLASLVLRTLDLTWVISLVSLVLQLENNLLWHSFCNMSANSPNKSSVIHQSVFLSVCLHTYLSTCLFIIYSINSDSLKNTD